MIGLAQQDLLSAGKQLSELISKGSGSAEIPQLRVLVRYFALLGKETKLDNASRQLVEAIDTQTKQFSKYANVALQEENQRWAQSILHKMGRLNSPAVTRADLKEKIEKLKQIDIKPVDNYPE